MASSTTKPVAMVSAISDRLLRLKPNRYIAPSVPTSDSGTDRLGIRVARALRRNTKITSTTRMTASVSSNSTSSHRGADGHGAVGQDVEVDRGRQRGLQLRQQRLDALDHRDDVGAGLALDVEDDGRRLVHPGAELVVLGAVDDVADIAEPDRRAVLVGDDQRFVVAGVADLVVGVDGVGAHRAVEIALRRVDVGVAERGAQIVDVQPVGGELADIGADPHRRPLAAADADEADAGKLRDLLRQAGVDEILDLRQRHGLRGQPQRQDRRVGRIDLGVDRRRGQVGRQQVAGGVDRGLHFLLGDVERNRQARTAA